MKDETIMTMEQALATVGIKTQYNGKNKMFDDVMDELRIKWHELDQCGKQLVANAFVRFMLK